MYGYEKCEDADGDLMGLSLIVSDTSNRNRINLNLNGRPEDLVDEDCSGYAFPSPRISKAAIYADANKVYGVKFLSIIGESDLGSLKGTPTVVEFGRLTIPIGFYGTYGPAGITSLGILSHDPACIAIIPPAPPTPEPEPVIEDKESVDDGDGDGEDSGNAAAIAVGIIVPLILIAGGVAALLWWRKRKRRGEMGGVTTVSQEEIE